MVWNYIKDELQPKGIVAISAHFTSTDESKILVDISEKPILIHDFPDHPLYDNFEYTWDLQGSPELGERVITTLKDFGIDAMGVHRGCDHGVWVPFRRGMKSSADIPIVSVSMFSYHCMPSYVKLGEALSSLRDDGIVIVASGKLVHNLAMRRYFKNKASPTFVKEFDDEAERIVSVGAAGDDEGTKIFDMYATSMSWGSFAFGLPNHTRLAQYDNDMTS
ncbi:hypothetical protein EC973_007123 [Apophysomyces ossiformis]|uniref:Extradiol ring-cleavage dioxygenase class III enzyme subunit B domain-containing protein n=1 Tax=Apophysomyces ossiformis TaxID=679940 RepID=A0A8H7EU18_9FUNG|nr:hypothetical protein EC973_007123 [Apophysomyces ossiformis]